MSGDNVVAQSETRQYFNILTMLNAAASAAVHDFRDDLLDELDVLSLHTDQKWLRRRAGAILRRYGKTPSAEARS